MIFVFPMLLLDLFISMKVGMIIGFGYSVIWILASFLIGMGLVKYSYVSILQATDFMKKGKIDIKNFYKSNMSYLLGAILLIVPGVLTDSFGLLSLIYTLYLHLIAKITPENKKTNFKENDDVIDVEIINSSTDSNDRG